MDYFDKQDSNKAAQQQENYNHNQAQEPGYHIQSKNVFPDNWKVPQDGDFDFVSIISRECLAKSKLKLQIGPLSLSLYVSLLFFACCHSAEEPGL